VVYDYPFGIYFGIIVLPIVLRFASPLIGAPAQGEDAKGSLHNSETVKESAKVSDSAIPNSADTLKLEVNVLGLEPGASTQRPPEPIGKCVGA
jgi:hypothetical protein